MSVEAAFVHVMEIEVNRVEMFRKRLEYLFANGK